MRFLSHRLAASVIALSVLATGGVASAQTADFLRNEVAAAQTVKGVPFSGEGVITLKLTLYDGTKIERTVPAKYYRDSQGRVRREQTIMGLAPLTPGGDLQSVVTIVDPVAGYVYTIVGRKREVQRVPLMTAQLSAALKSVVESTRALAAKQSDMMPPGFATREEALGTRDIDGIAAIGKKTTTTIPAGFMGNDRPLEVTDEQWEAVDLKVLLLTRYHDPRTGDVEYRLSKITRAEPPADLFAVPAGYRIVDIK
jgi:hypothetical protein